MRYIVIYKAVEPPGSVCEDYWRSSGPVGAPPVAYRSVRHPESPAEPIPMTLGLYILLYNTYKSTQP